jgi:hypothetical protein
MNTIRLREFTDAEEFDSWAAYGRELADQQVDEQMVAIERLIEASQSDSEKRGVLVSVSDDGHVVASLSSDVAQGVIAHRRTW